MCEKKLSAGRFCGSTGEQREQETSMSKTLIAAVAAVFSLAVLAGCDQNRQEEFTIVEPVQPIYVEPVARSKYR